MVTTAVYPKPRILAELPQQGHVVIEASAGTGKTYTLEHLVIELLLVHGARIDEILVVTFTEKATAELRVRMREKLEELLEVARTGGGLAPEGPAWELDATAQARLTAALHALDTATIATIHSFCQRVLTEHAFANGRLFSQTQSDGAEAFSEAFREALRGQFAREEIDRGFLQCWLDEGNSVEQLQQLLSALHRERGEHRPRYSHPAILEACALLSRALQAAGPLDRALKAQKVHASTVKALVTRFQQLAPVLESAPSLGPPALLARLAELRSGRGKDELAYLLDKTPASGALAPLRAAVAGLESVAVSLEAALVQRFLPAVRERLERRKREQGLFDFDDMLALVHESLHGERGDELARILRTQYRFALIDEFQDTDEIQWGIFSRAFFEGGARMFLVGDPKQAIYRFRGADVHTYLRAKAEVAQRGGSCVSLEENFRSTQGVLAAHNRIFAGPGEPAFFTGANGSGAPVTCGRKDLVTLGLDGRPAVPVQLLHLFAIGSKLNAKEVRNRLHNEVAREIKDLLDARAPSLRFGPAGDERPLRARDVYCLTYAAWEGLELGEVLREWGIPHGFFKQDGLFQTEEAGHVRDLLAAIAEPLDRERRLRAWLTPFFGLTLSGLADAADVAGTHPLLAHLFRWKALAADKAWARLFSDILECSGLVRRELFWAYSERALTNYLHLFEVLLQQASRTKGTLSDLVRQLRGWINERQPPPGQDGNVQRLESERDAVQLMTMHKSKGLEAAVVFVVGGFSAPGGGGHFEVFHDPDTHRRCALIGKTADAAVNALILNEAAEEQQRLLYVALTRAKARLYLPYFGPPRPGDIAAGAEFSTFNVDGSYAAVQRRLQSLVEGGDESFAALASRAIVPSAPAASRAAAGPVDSWTPPPELLAEPAPTVDFDRLRAGHAGFVVTSYSRLSAERAAAEEPEVAHDAPLAPPEPDDLPGGSAVGTLLHELLENAPLAVTAATPDPAAWREHPEVRPGLEATFARFALEPRHVACAAELAHTALVAPVRLPGGELLRGLASADRVLRELEFLYPIPERAHPRLGELPRAEGWRIERGFVKGFVDLVFEHGGRVYFGDWKSDRLAAFTAEALAAHVGAHYDLQIGLYTLALVKLLEIRDEADYEARFGGLLYLFLRAMRRDGTGVEGIHSTRPSWDEVCAFERSLGTGELAPKRKGREAA